LKWKLEITIEKGSDDSWMGEIWQTQPKREMIVAERNYSNPLSVLRMLLSDLADEKDTLLKTMPSSTQLLHPEDLKE